LFGEFSHMVSFRSHRVERIVRVRLCGPEGPNLLCPREFVILGVFGFRFRWAAHQGKYQGWAGAFCSKEKNR
jgi:hypothetical protein